MVRGRIDQSQGSIEIVCYERAAGDLIAGAGAIPALVGLAQAISTSVSEPVSVTTVPQER